MHPFAGWLWVGLYYNVPVDPLRDLGRTLLVFGGLLAMLGALLYFGGKLPFRLGRLPGDIVHRGEHTTFYFPIVTCLLLSLCISFIFWLFTHIRK
ncbi:MAG TPA: DUF2905 domain-containing protein [Candidatus Methylomirabilis sp.]|nr:DUF2905 domain-containing protein [Candidatus Methylomirabilis sp.]